MAEVFMDGGAAFTDAMSIDAGIVKHVIQQLFRSSLLDGEPVQAVMPRGMLEIGSMPRQHFGSALKFVQVKKKRISRHAWKA